ncbi:MAG: hypothetical protein U9N36_09050 [Euryarchaeota archaeon]|nr:hypothetical protein [Euryarchaeota archaeon]
MNSTLDVIIVNKCNQSYEFQTVLPAKMCVRVLLIMVLAAVADLLALEVNRTRSKWFTRSLIVFTLWAAAADTI